MALTRPTSHRMRGRYRAALPVSVTNVIEFRRSIRESDDGLMRG